MPEQSAEKRAAMQLATEIRRTLHNALHEHPHGISHLVSHDGRTEEEVQAVFKRLRDMSNTIHDALELGLQLSDDELDEVDRAAGLDP